MTTSYGVSAYQSHDLNIAMKTSSGDVIKMDFSNVQSGSYSHTQNGSGSVDKLSYSSMQSFQFSVDSNGISAQDKKEIDGFMKIAKPFIDDFLKELQDSSQNSPVSQIAQKIAAIFEPSRPRDENHKNHIKTNIVKAFDNSMKDAQANNKPTTTPLEQMFKDMQKLLENTLKAFDEFNTKVYA